MKIYITSAKSQCSVLIELQSQIVPLNSFYFPRTIKISVFLDDLEIMKTSWNIKRNIDYIKCALLITEIQIRRLPISHNGLLFHGIKVKCEECIFVSLIIGFL